MSDLNGLDPQYQMISGLPTMATRAAYEAACAEAGVQALTVHEMANWAYALQYADYTRTEWLAKSREARAQFVLSAAHLRDERAAQPKPTPAPLPVYRFTCRRCGEHRDTTVGGHCDDCEA